TFSRLRPTTSTLAPSLAKRVAMASPTLTCPPVTMAVRPCSRWLMDSVDPGAEAIGKALEAEAVGAPGEPHEQRTAQHVLLRHGSPAAAVEGVVAVVAHHEELAVGHDERPEVSRGVMAG